MTIQEQLEKLNSTFERLHSDFIRLDSDKRNLDAKYASIARTVKAKYQNERTQLIQQQEEVFKYYRIAKDNSNKELVHSGVTPQKPDLGRLNNMIERVNSYSRTDPVAGQIIDLCNAYNAYLEVEIKKIDLRENAELQNIDRNKTDEANNIVYKKGKVLQDCEDYLKGDDLKNLVSLFEMIHTECEITKSYFDNWTIPTKRKRMMLLGFSQYRVDVAQKLCPTLKKSLGHEIFLCYIAEE